MPIPNDRAGGAYLRFLGACRAYWAEPLFQALRREVDAAAARNPALRVSGPAFDAFLAGLATHQYFGWFERHLQRMKYSGRWGIAATLEQRRASLLATLDAPLPEAMLMLDPDFEPPAYYREFDIHQHPGGLDGDELAGFVYREAVGYGIVGKPQLHERFATLAMRDRQAGRIADLGCGFGRAAFAFARAAPAASVDGIDASAACLRLAAQSTPASLAPSIRFRQADAAATGLPAASYDVVTSTMLLHEMPEDAVLRLIDESARLLVPGGTAIHLDFLAPADPLLRALFAGHARRNNEPFLLDHGGIDATAAYTRAGFRDVRIEDFAEEDGALDDPARTWRLPWKVITARR